MHKTSKALMVFFPLLGTAMSIVVMVVNIDGKVTTSLQRAQVLISYKKVPNCQVFFEKSTEIKIYHHC